MEITPKRLESGENGKGRLGEGNKEGKGLRMGGKKGKRRGGRKGIRREKAGEREREGEERGDMVGMDRKGRGGDGRVRWIERGKCFGFQVINRWTVD